MALGACGKHPSTGAPAGARLPAPAMRSSAPPSVRPTPPAPKSADQGGVAPAKLTRLNEDGSETIEDATGDSGARNPLLAAVASTVSAGSSSASAAVTGGPTTWQEGVNYTRLVPGQPTSVPPGQVEVLEFFWYACSHCYALDPLVETWKMTKPSYITFSRVPVLWNEGHRAMARLFYTLEALGKLELLHSEIFKEIHLNGNPLIAADPANSAETERIQLVFVKKFGITDDAFKAAYHSMGVDTAVRHADELVQRFRIDAVPKFVVNGKYMGDVGTAGSPEKLLSLIGDLAAQEHKR